MDNFEVQKEALKRIIREFSKAGNYIEAIPYMEQYCELIKNHYGADSDRYITVINDLGGMYRNVGNFEKSYETFNNALKLIEQKIGNRSEQYATATVNLACMYRLTEEFDKAESMFLNAINIYDSDETMQKILKSEISSIDKETLVRKSTLYANASNNLATLYQDMGKIDESIERLSKSLELLKNTSNHEYIAISLCNLANALMQSGKLDEAESVNLSSIEMFKKHLTTEHPSYLTALNNQGSIYFYKRQYEKALQNFETVEPLLKATYGENSPQYKYLTYNIQEVKNKININANTNNDSIVDEIVKIEWEMFQRVNNTGGRAGCQDDLNTFEIMRKSQYKAWRYDLLESYLEDLNKAVYHHKNLIMEKYARMMKHTHFLEYLEIKDALPKISPEKELLIEKVCELYKEQDEIYSAKYPKLRKTGRPSDPSKTATVDIYFEGEVMTFSEKTLQIFQNYLEELKSKNLSLAILINENISKAYGYSSIEDAESKL